MTPIVLASASPRRKALLEALGIEVAVLATDIDEIETGHPIEVALANARRKRERAVETLASTALVIAADTVVVVDSDLLGKPRDLDEARDMIRRLSGRAHEVITGVAVEDMASGLRAEGIERTEVIFRTLSDAEIRAFVNAVRPLDRAGAYTVDGPGSLLVAAYRGCYQNVLGLPMVRLDEVLRTIGDGLFAWMRPESARFL